MLSLYSGVRKHITLTTDFCDNTKPLHACTLFSFQHIMGQIINFLFKNFVTPNHKMMMDRSGTAYIKQNDF